MYDFPTLPCSVKDDSPSIQVSHSIIEMERCDRHLSQELYSQFFLLNVHVWSGRFAAAYLLEHGIESPLEFSASVGTLRHRTRIKHRGVVIKRQSELLPI